MPDYGLAKSGDDPDFDLFSIEEKREMLYKPGGFFDEKPKIGPLINKIVLEWGCRDWSKQFFPFLI